MGVALISRVVHKNMARTCAYSLDLVKLDQGEPHNLFSSLWSLLSYPKHKYLGIILDCGSFLRVKALEWSNNPIKRPPSHGVDNFSS